MFKKMCEDNKELKLAHIQYLRVQKILSQQKVEKGVFKNRIEASKNDPNKIELMNKVRELEKSNSELA